MLTNEAKKIALDRQGFIDVLKGICIIFIVITHYNWTDAERLQYLFPFWIDMAVPIFMIVSGFVYAKSYERHKIVLFGDAYSRKNIVNKMIRYTVPFMIAFVLEEAALAISGQMEVTALQMVLDFFRGGIGPGSFYYPVIIQLVFVFPVIYFIIKSYDFKGLIICGLANAIYELLQKAYGMNAECYRLLLFRYILVIAFGCYLAIGEYKISRKQYTITMLLGIVFIVACCYVGYRPFIVIYWTRTSFLACLYIMPITAALIKGVSLRCKPLEVLGKALFNIFLVQMVYYNGASLLYGLVGNRLLQLLINLFICIVAGIIFYYLETPITRFVNEKAYQIIINKKVRDKI